MAGLGKRLVLSVCSIVAALLVSEGVVRALGIAPGFGRVEFGDIATSSDPILGWTNAAGAPGVNSLGLRGAEPRSPKPARRIVVVGDSVAYGYGLEPGQSIPARLEAVLRERGGDVEVLNGGVVAYSARQEGRWLEVHGEALDPDEVIVLYCLNDSTDLRGALPEDLVRKAYKAGKKDDWERERGLQALSPGLTRLLELSHAARALYFRMKQPQNLAIAGNAELTAKGWSKDFSVVEDGFGRIARFAAKEKLPVRLVIFPWLDALDRYPHREQHERVAAIGRGFGFQVIDLLPFFAEHAARVSKDLALPGDPVHPNAAGAEVAARAIAESIQS